MQPAIQLIIFGGTSSASGSGTAPDALVIEWASSATDNTPQIWITGGMVAAGDVLHLLLDTVNTFNSGNLVTATPHTVTQAEIDAGTIPITIGTTLADGTWFAEGFNVRSGVQGANSNIVSQTIAVYTPAILDAATKASDVTLTNANLTATNGTTTQYHGARSNVSHGSGKHCFEVTFDALSLTFFESIGAGVCTSGFTQLSYLGDTAAGGSSAGYFGGDGHVYMNANGVFTASPVMTSNLGTGDKIFVCHDGDAKLLFFKRTTSGVYGDYNADPLADPVTGVGGIDISGWTAGAVFAAIELGRGDTATFNPNPSGQPTGYGGW